MPKKQNQRTLCPQIPHLDIEVSHAVTIISNGWKLDLSFDCFKNLIASEKQNVFKWKKQCIMKNEQFWICCSSKSSDFFQNHPLFFLRCYNNELSMFKNLPPPNWNENSKLHFGFNLGVKTPSVTMPDFQGPCQLVESTTTRQLGSLCSARR